MFYKDRLCENITCQKWYTPRSGTQHFCEDPECVAEVDRRVKKGRVEARRRSRQVARSKLTCKRCGATFAGSRLNTPQCQRCREERPTIFVGVDGEGIQGPCSLCDCPGYRSREPNDAQVANPLERSGKKETKVCLCGHHKYSSHPHRYVMLGCGDEYIANPDGLHFTEIFRFLYDQHRKRPWAVFVGFFLSYDFTMWLKTLPKEAAWYLLTDKGRNARLREGENTSGWWPVRVGQDQLGTDEAWEFDMLAMKRIKIRPLICDCDWTPNKECTHDCERGEWMTICDAGPFYQSSLLSVIEPTEKKWPDGSVCSWDEYARIEQGKSQRSNAALDDDMIEYNRLENEILSRLLSHLDGGFRSIGVKLRRDQWYGPGAASAAWLRLIGAPKRDDLEAVLDGKPVIPSPAREAGRMSYYGGWFEVMKHGNIPGVTYEYDINSAYPAITARLPCLFHGTWKQDKTKTLSPVKANELRLVKAEVLGSNPHIGAMLHRQKNNSILRPQHTAGWFWQHELEAALRAKLIDEVRCEEAWRYRKCACTSPFAAIAELYDMRRRIGKETPTGKAIKLVINSVYGKLTQSVGVRPFSLYIYASLITAGTRTMILDAIATHTPMAPKR